MADIFEDGDNDTLSWDSGVVGEPFFLELLLFFDEVGEVLGFVL